MELPDDALALADHQLNLLTRRQLSGCGVSLDAVQWRTSRVWRLVLPGVVLLHRGLPTEQQRMVAALLYAGDGSWLGGVTAAALHGIGGRQVTAPIDVGVPASRKPRRVAWLSIRSTTLVGDPLMERGPLRWSGVPRAVVEAAADLADERQARSLVLDAVQRRLVRLDDLEHWVDRGTSRRTARLRRLLHEAAAGVRSAPEGDLSQLILTSSALPAATFNPVLVDAAARALTSPDAWFDDVGLAVMVHSRNYHADGLDWDATVESGSDLSTAGVAVVGVTASALARTPDRQLARVERAYAAAALRPRPEVMATPRLTVPGLRPAEPGWVCRVGCVGRQVKSSRGSAATVVRRRGPESLVFSLIKASSDPRSGEHLAVRQARTSDRPRPADERRVRSPPQVTSR